MAPTYVYIDGLNLYYFIKGPPLSGRGKWLDLEALADRLVDPPAEVERVRYFTARVLELNDDPGPAARQDIYLRALQALSRVSVTFGTMKIRDKTVLLSSPAPGQSRFARARVPEEKGSDVNLAAHLVLDAACGRFASAVVVTNDSDLAEPLRLVCAELGKRVRLVHPSERPAGTWKQVPGIEVVPLWPATILKCQLPPEVPTPTGVVTRPDAWL